MTEDLRLGFTGSQHGVTTAQRYALLHVLARYRLFGALWMHNGDCLGADNVAAKLWQELDGKVHLHPPSIDTKRAFMYGEFVEAPRPYLDRNKDIVCSCDELVATPAEMFEQLRSGTWATIRFARKIGRPVTIIWPNGTYTRDSDAGSAEDPKGLHSEGAAARAEGIAKNTSPNPPPVSRD